MLSPSEFIEENYSNLHIDKSAAKFLMLEYAKLVVIEELEKHIEHPTKPGYKRHDIVNRIKELKLK